MKTIVILGVLFHSFLLLSQNTFETIYGSYKEEQMQSLIELSDGSYILAGSNNSILSDSTNQYIIKLNPEGEVLIEKILNNEDTDCHFNTVLEIDDNIYLIGGCMYPDPMNGELSVIVTNSELEIIKELSFQIPDDKQIFYSNAILDSDSNIVVTGFTTEMEPSYTNNSFFYKFNLNGDSLNSNFTASNKMYNHSYDIIESYDSSKYFAFTDFFSDVYATNGQIISFDKNFNLLAIDSVPYSMRRIYSPLHINDSLTLISCFSTLPPHYQLKILTLNDSFEPINFNSFKQPQYEEFPAYYNATSKNGNNIYVGSTTNFLMDYYGNQDSWFHLIKLNPDLSPIWEKWYGHHYHMLHNILATNDGGCIMVGTSYDSETQSEEKDIYIVKVDSDGLITWEKEIPFPQSTTTGYPNPGKKKLFLKTTVLAANFQLTNLQGKVILQQNIQNDITEINTQTISSGTYLWTLTKEGRVVESGKWVKN